MPCIAAPTTRPPTSSSTPTTRSLSGHGLTFTNGRGTEVCVAAIRALEPLVVGRTLEGITGDFAAFWRSLVSEDQLRWLGPEKGVMHISTAAVVNAVWDLWAKSARRPVWRLLADLSPEEIVAAVDFRYIADALAPDEASTCCGQRRRGARSASARCASGLSGVHDLGRLARLRRREGRAPRARALADGFRHVKMKVGQRHRVRRPPRRADPRRARRRRHADDGREPGLGRRRGDRDDARARGVRPVVDRGADEPRRHPRARAHPPGDRPDRGRDGRARAEPDLFKQLLQAEAIDVVQIDACRVAG